MFYFSTSFIFSQEYLPKSNLSLNEAIEIGIKNNPQLSRALNKVNAMGGKIWSGISLPMPEISNTYEYVPNGQPLKNSAEKTLEIKQSFDFPLLYYLRGAKTSDEKEIAENEFLQTKLALITQIKSVYYNLLAKGELLHLAEENLLIAEDFFKKAEIRNNIGEGTNLEKLTAKVQTMEARNNCEIQKNQIKAAAAELNYTLGIKSDEKVNNFILTDSLMYRQYNLSFKQLLNIATGANPELRISELNLSAASTNKKLAWSSLLPNFNVSYYKQVLDGNSGYYGASFGISIPLWFLFDQRGQIEEATSNVLAAEDENRSVKNSIYLKIHNAFIEYQNADKQVQLYIKDILPQAEEMFRVALKSYEAGEITYLEYLQSKQTLINSKTNYINTLLAFNLAIASLEQAAGIGVSK
jgi:outer membrane protein TolC